MRYTPEQKANWDSVIQLLKENLSDVAQTASFNTWLKPLKLHAVTADTIVIICENAFSMKHVQTHYATMLYSTVKLVFNRTYELEFHVQGDIIDPQPADDPDRASTIDANDQMTLFDEEMPSKTALNITYPITLYNLAAAMCSYLGVTLKDSSWLNSTLSVTKEPKQFDGATMREVLGWIAEAGCSNARFDRNGLLEFVWFSTVNKTYDENDYTEFTPAWYETAAIDGLHIRNADSTSEFTVGTGDNAYMIQDNPFLRQSD